MATQILDAVAKEPPLLRWLHSHDPDRPITAQLLASSASWYSHVPSFETSRLSPHSYSTISTSSLLVPMYRRKHFVLGQLYGPQSLNGMILNILAPSAYRSRPTPISRRFVADLSFPTLDFLEYEWLSDGKLCVTIHHFEQSGLYNGQTLLLDSGVELDYPLTFHDLLTDIHRPVPSKVIMRADIVENPSCESCSDKPVHCHCAPTFLSDVSQHSLRPPANWHSWIRALNHTRRCKYASFTVNITLASTHGDTSRSDHVFVKQGFQIGGINATSLVDSTLNMHQMLGCFQDPFSNSYIQSLSLNDLDHQSRDGVSDGGSSTCFKQHNITPNTHFKSVQNCTPIISVSASTDAKLAWGSDDHAESQGVVDHIEASFNSFGLNRCASEVTSSVHDLQNSSCDSLGKPPYDDNSTQCATVTPDSGEAGPTSAVSVGTDGDGLAMGASNDAGCNEQVGSGLVPNEQQSGKVSVCGSASLKSRESKSINASSSCRSTSPLSCTSPSLKVRSTKPRKRRFVCECGKEFNHRGHYNEHRLCVHDRVRHHQCAYLNCQRYVHLIYLFFFSSFFNKHYRSYLPMQYF